MYKCGGFKKMMQRFPWSQRMGGTISEATGMQHWLWNSSEMVRVREIFLQQVLDDRTFLDTFEQQFFEKWHAYVTAEQEFLRLYDSRSPHERMILLHTLCDIESEVCAYGYMNDIFLTTGGADWLMDWFVKELPATRADRDSVIAELSVPVQTSFVQDEKLALIQIGLQPKNQRKALLEQHAAAWHWVENSYIESDPLSAEQFDKKLIALEKAGDVTEEHRAALEHASEQKQQRKAAVFGAMNASQQLRTIIDCSDRISHMTDMRKMGVLRLNGAIWKTFRDYAAAEGVPFETLAWMIPAEIVDCVQSGNWNVVQERAASGAITMIDAGEFAMIQGPSFQSLDLSPFFGDTTGKTSLHGQVAYNGVVRGVARVIKGRNDFADFHDGEILITNQTTPEFVPLLKRAAAVVTEQGGITCHAAIVSRELKIPCIIGASSAMSFFKNGQMIIVDGEKGEVRYA
jgi:phosphohistidine swiveling domain-containing protein